MSSLSHCFTGFFKNGDLLPCAALLPAKKALTCGKPTVFLFLRSSFYAPLSKSIQLLRFSHNKKYHYQNKK